MDNNNNSNQILNSLADGELDAEQAKKLLSELDSDEALRNEMCEIHRVKDLLQFAYPLNSDKEMSELDIQTGKSYGSLAASFLLVLSFGLLAGYFISNTLHTGSKLTAAVPIVSPSKNKVIVYLGSSDKDKLSQTLDKAEALLTEYQREGIEVYVVTSAGGIDLLRDNQSRAQQRIMKMTGQYKSLHFVACNNQIYQLHRKGQPVNLVDQVEVAPSAVQFVVDHLKKGWTYIAI